MTREEKVMEWLRELQDEAKHAQEAEEDLAEGTSDEFGSAQALRNAEIVENWQQHAGEAAPLLIKAVLETLERCTASAAQLRDMAQRLKLDRSYETAARCDASARRVEVVKEYLVMVLAESEKKVDGIIHTLNDGREEA